MNTKKHTKKHLCGLVVGIGLALGVCSAQAAMISLVPVSGAVASGGQATFNLVANFGTDVTLGGATDIAWDSSVLTYASFSFGVSLAPPVRDTAFDVVDLQDPGLLSIGFGNFGGITLASDTIVGLLTFNAVGAPGSSTAIDLTDSVKWAGFFDTAGAPITTSYTGTTGSITPAAPIPLPAAGWLMLSGLAGLGLLRRRPQSA